MSEINQHQLAQWLLPIIRDANATNRFPKYQAVAEELGLPVGYARTIGQACDLLDAAAALAGIPLLALFRVRDINGKINPEAWLKTEPDFRDDIIKCAENHKFTDGDFVAIERALVSLKGLGNRRAWAKIRREIPRLQLLKRLTTPPQIQDAVDDLDIGADSPEKKESSGTRYVRDPRVRKAVIERANGKCEFCGADGFKCADGSKYLETHHIIALANDGEDRITNVIALCANHHREAHFGERRDELEKTMIAKMKELCMKAGKN